ncbi:hypothetical protein PM082_013177 [Marasmius tenuissimus]|nr:hypothetical protein PM082_013177 [Marasmius tenuissimus]
MHTTPDELRSLVLDYLTHSGYIRSAQTFLSDSAVHHIDVDGDEVMDTNTQPDISEDTVRRAQLRNEIRHEIRCGRINEAVSIINKQFPPVLSMQAGAEVDGRLGTGSPSTAAIEYAPSKSTHPAHLLLNVRIQAFVEACRTVPLEYPPKPTSEKNKSASTVNGMDRSTSSSDSPETIDKQTALLKSAQKLYALANMLSSKEENERYMKELQNVVGLIAYPVPETSPIASYLAQEHREALADQIDSAILRHLDQTVVSRLELLLRRTCTTWGLLNDLQAPLKPGGPPFPPGYVRLPVPSPGKSEKLPVCPTLDIPSFLDA